MKSKTACFSDHLLANGLSTTRSTIEILQINNGRKCNQACLHCHVEAGPSRTEEMSEEVTSRVLTLLEHSPSIHTVDITGGAPELNKHFRRVVQVSSMLGKQVIDRCNLTILFEEGFEDLGQFLHEHKVHVIASLPCYTPENVEKQRGRGVFGKSIEGLLLLNSLGYGRGDSRWQLDLVYNPVGAILPPCQEKLEKDYKKRLRKDFGITFDHLFTITNMPIRRFLHQLRRWGKEDEYMSMLRTNFNSYAAQNVMCRNLVSVSWDGYLYDCDFNQMLELPAGGSRTSIWDIHSFEELSEKEIAFDSHCFGCTAGAGSSCSGTLL